MNEKVKGYIQHAWSIISIILIILLMWYGSIFFILGFVVGVGLTGWLFTTDNPILLTMLSLFGLRLNPTIDKYLHDDDEKDAQKRQDEIKKKYY